MYHSLLDAGMLCYKWLNYRSLADSFIDNENEIITKIYYFSAITPWDQEKARRHKIYIKALETENINIVLGKFKTTTCRCEADCQKKYKKYSEKQTDVNIAIHMMKTAFQDDIDKILLFSGDSDLIPAVNMIKKSYPTIIIKSIFPYKRFSKALKEESHEYSRIRTNHFELHQFPEKIIIKTSKRQYYIEKPSEWC